MIKKVLKSVTTLCLGVGLVVGLASCGENFSNGSRVGYVVKLSEKGHFNKTYEGVLLSIVPGQITPKKWYFSVREETAKANPKIIDDLNSCMLNNYRCQLHYKQDAFTNPTEIETGYDIQRVVKAEVKASGKDLEDIQRFR